MRERRCQTYRSDRPLDGVPMHGVGCADLATGRQMISDTARRYIEAARCPPTFPTGDFGLWKIERAAATNALHQKMIGFDSYIILSRWTEATLHLARGEIVMEDSFTELSK